jgi:hypothetical protein
MNSGEFRGHHSFCVGVLGLINRPQLGPAFDNRDLADRAAQVIVAQLAADADVLQQIAHVGHLHHGFSAVNEFHWGRTGTALPCGEPSAADSGGQPRPYFHTLASNSKVSPSRRQMTRSRFSVRNHVTC